MTDHDGSGLVLIGHVDALGPCNYSQRSGEGLPSTVAAVWRSEVRRSGYLHVVPDCCVELVRGPHGSVEIWGPSVAARRVWLQRGATYHGVRLRVGAFTTVLGVPADALVGQVVAAVDVGLGRTLPVASRADWLVRVLDLASEGDAAWLRDAVASRAPVLLEVRRVGIPAVAATLGLGERQLRRRFAHAAGVSPAAYRRLVRTRAALRDLAAAITQPRVTIADIAYEHGFTDQSHLTREVVELTGITPGALRRSRVHEPRPGAPGEHD